MAMTQMGLIQSLGEAMAWFEREVAWGVRPTELRHLCGRIGELFVAVITNGRMAPAVNQKGYDVVSSAKERISVKTTATVGPARPVTFNVNTLSEVDRIIILRVNTEEREIEILFDAPIAEAETRMGPASRGRRALSLNDLPVRPPRTIEDRVVLEVSHEEYTIREMENGSIQVLVNGEPVIPVKPALRGLAEKLNIGLLNSNGNPHNTRHLGGLIIRSIQARKNS